MSGVGRCQAIYNPCSVTMYVLQIRDPDYSPDAGTGLFPPLSCKPCYAEFYVGKIRRIGLRIARCSEAWFYNGFIH